MSRDRLLQQLMRDEGLELSPYPDTQGFLTIGYGRNLTENGITLAEAAMLLSNDVDTAIADVLKVFPWVSQMSHARQAVVYNMAFNLGITKLKGFKTTLKAMERGDWRAAAAGMRQSLWAKQVKARAERLARQLEYDTWE